jgi:hypothetical protein
MIFDQMREPAMLKEFERQLVPVSSVATTVPANSAGLGFLSLTNAIFIAGISATWVEAAIEF